MKQCKARKALATFVAFMMVLSVMMPVSLFANTASTSTTGVTNSVTPKDQAEKKTSNAAKTIDVISINDFHGTLTEDTSEKGKNMGMAKVINAVKGYKTANPNTMVVSAGDIYQGSAMSNLTYGAPVSEMLKEMGVTASAVGNHEFDWGIDKAAQWQKEGQFTFVAANIVDKTTGKPVEWAKPYIVKTVNGVKVGFVGLATRETATTALAKNVENYEFADLKVTATKWVDYLKSGKAPEGKVDVVIALTHVASFQNEVKGEKTGKVTKPVTGDVVDSGLCTVKGLDAVISAHSHQTVAGYAGKVPVVQGYYNGRALGHLTISLDKNNKVLGIKPEVDVLYNRKAELTADAAGQKIYSTYEEKLKPILSDLVGKTETGLEHTRTNKVGTSTLGYWTCDIMRKEAGTQIGLNNQGGLRDSIPAGDITMSTLYTVMPFDNTLCKLEMSGTELKKVIENGVNNEERGFWMEVAGLKITYDLTKPFGSRVVEMYLDNGTKVEMDKTYTVATNNFMATNGDGFDFSKAISNVDTFVPIRDVMVKAIKAAKMVNVTLSQPFVDANASVAKKAA